MEPTVIFRDFEERDIDFIYRCKNDEKLSSTIVGQFRPFSHEDAEKWVHGCMGEHETYKFWAIATNDGEKHIVGWVSLSEIDYINKSAFYHGIVIADPQYHDGFAWIETYLFVMEYAFDRLNLNRLYGSNIKGHKHSGFVGKLFFWQHEGIMRQAVYKDGEFYDLSFGSILREEYEEHKGNGDYEMKQILRRFRQLRK